MADDLEDQPSEPLSRGKPCPRCGSLKLRNGAWPWYLGTVGALFCRAVQCVECLHEFDYNNPEADFAKRKLKLAIIINTIGGLGIIAVLGLLALWLLKFSQP